MGMGPEYLVRGGIAKRLRALECTVDTACVETDDAFPMEVRTAFELCRTLAERVRDAMDADRVPLVLAGNCDTCVGTLGGIGSEDVGIVWLDAHSDFHTPETTSTGFVDGMALAMATGHCWARMAERVPGFAPVDGGRVVLLGARDYGRATAARLTEAGISVVKPDDVRRDGLRAALVPALDALRERVKRIYLHIDLDVLDPAVARANEYDEPGGLDYHELVEAVRLVGERFHVAAAALTSLDPACDKDGKALAAAFDAAAAIFAPGISDDHGSV
jgi:arginase